MADEIEPLARLGKRVREVAASEDMSLDRFVVAPSLDNENHKVFAYFTLGEDKPVRKVTKKKREADPKFEKMIEETRKADDDQKFKDAAERARRMAERFNDPGKGLGLDD